ncbi:MAG: Trp family transcriptional regulator [bacterium]
MAKGIYLKSLSQVAKVLFSIQEEKQLRGCLEDILTPQEIIEIGERIQLCRELLQGKTQRGIAEKLGISVTTVNRGARILKFGT